MQTHFLHLSSKPTPIKASQSFENSDTTNMAVLSTLSWCCCINADPEPSDVEKPLITRAPSDAQYKDNPSAAEVADDIITKLFTAEKNDIALEANLRSMVHTYGWYDNLAAAILASMEQAIELGKEMGPAVKAAYEKAVVAVNKVKEWADAHPEMAAVIITLIALGVLAVMMPWLMAYLGFAEEGILEGESVGYFYSGLVDKFVASWAARWQATYCGFVPKGSLFSYLQSLGTKIGRNWHG
jgi:hypothetical protein